MITTRTAPGPGKVIDLVAIEARLRPKSPQYLRFRFSQCLTGAVEFIAEAAVCAKLLKEHGEDLRGLPHVQTFLGIARGRILAEAVAKFLESDCKQLVFAAPIDVQARLVRDSVVDFVKVRPEGGFEPESIDLATAPLGVAKQVIGPDGIRSVEDQMDHLWSHPATTTVAAKARGMRTYRPHLVLTEEQWQSVRMHAAAEKCEEREILMRALEQGGIFRPPTI
jgi:hypothetical protein